MKKIIKTNKAPEAIGPYSQAVCTGDFLFTSGQIPVNPETGKIPDTLEKQANQAFLNLTNLVKESGFEITDIIKTVVFIKDMNDFSKINEIYGKYFETPYPARSCVEVSRLPKDVFLEVEAIAHRGN